MNHDDAAEGLSQGLDIGCVSLCRSNIDTKSSGCHVVSWHFVI